jgi:peptidoglycan/LPS O-acetylase OafA/YrhL
MNARLIGYDLIRSFAIFIIYFGHIDKQITHESVLCFSYNGSPISLSLLSFISAVLILKKKEPIEILMVKRISKIFIPLFFCLSCVLILHYFQNKNIFCQHTLLHFMGLTAFFDIFAVSNTASIGSGLWFITAICTMYIALPVLKLIFINHRGFIYLLLVILVSLFLNNNIDGSQRLWGVFIPFYLGVYLTVNDKIKSLTEINIIVSGLSVILVLIVSTVVIAQRQPYSVRLILYVFYPLAFVPLLFFISNILSEKALQVISFFSSISYEFYILHFYFINKNFYEIFPDHFGFCSHVILSFMMTLILSYFLSFFIKFFQRRLVSNISGMVLK